MKFLVITRRSKENGELSRGFLESFLDSLSYFEELQEEGKVVDSGVFPGEHSSYKVFEARDEEEVMDLLESSPLTEGVEHDVRRTVELDAVGEELKPVLAELS
ncbi:MAG: hypothetical protein MAG715_00470 [Methanonatronarchaeales archaeon]|nr:hypothetical protein [Methanonatronarchaeales archaeon]